MKVVIMGCGRVGAALAGRLSEEGHDVMVLDVRPDAFRRLPGDYRGKKHTGNGIDQDVLARIGVGEADVFIATTQGDNRNLLATQVAKHIFGVPRTLCRIYDPIREKIYRELGLETISPTIMGADAFYQLLTATPAPAAAKEA
jgi:trk system potassium uptake protein TrkA